MLTAAARKKTFLHPDTESWRKKKKIHRVISLTVASPLVLEILHFVYCNTDHKESREQYAITTEHLEFSKKVL